MNITSPTSQIQSDMLGDKKDLALTQAIGLKTISELDDIDAGDSEHTDYVRIPTSEPLDYYCDNFDEFVEKNKLTDIDEAQEMWDEEISHHFDHYADYQNSAISYLQ